MHAETCSVLQHALAREREEYKLRNERYLKIPRPHPPAAPRRITTGTPFLLYLCSGRVLLIPTTMHARPVLQRKLAREKSMGHTTSDTSRPPDACAAPHHHGHSVPPSMPACCRRPDAHVKCLCAACYPLVLTTFPTPYPYHYPYPVLPELHSLYHIPQRRERVPPTALCCAVLRVLHVHPAPNTS